MKRVLQPMALLGLALVLATGLTGCDQKKKAETAPAAAPAEGGATPPAETPPANP
jgi:hypothetical protein